MLVSMTSEKFIRLNMAAIEKLKSLIAEKLGVEPESTCVYELQVNSCSGNPAIIAIAKLGEASYALYAPPYLRDSQMITFKYVLADVDKDDKLIVFNERDYKYVKKELGNRQVDVKMLL